MHSTETRPLQNKGLCAAQMDAEVVSLNQLCYLSTDSAQFPHSPHVQQPETASNFLRERKTSKSKFPLTCERSTPLGQAENLGDSQNSKKKQKTSTSANVIPKRESSLSLSGKPLSSVLKNMELNPFLSLVDTWTEFIQTVSDPSFTPPWEDDPAQNYWPIQYPDETKLDALSVEDFPQNFEPSKFDVLPSHQDPEFSPPNPLLQNSRKILMGKSSSHFLAQSLLPAPNHQTPSPVLLASFGKAGSGNGAESRVPIYAQSSNRGKQRRYKFCSITSSVNSTSLFSQGKVPDPSVKGYLSSLACKKGMKIPSNPIWPPVGKAEDKTLNGRLPPFEAVRIWVCNKLPISAPQEHRIYINQFAHRFESHMLSIPIFSEKISYVCQSLHVEYYIPKYLSKGSEFEGKAIVQPILPRGKRRDLEILLEKFGKLFQRLLFYYSISESIIHRQDICPLISEISNWFLKELFHPEEFLPVCGISRNTVDNFGEKHFGVTQKITLLAISNGSTWSVETAALSLLVQWYKNEREKLWKKFGSEDHFWELFLKYLWRNWSFNLTPNMFPTI
ncbi:hypothetical protein O181_019920 [Austropuccinia psidii MF-1]|uniref:Uncharacterized protein n=1 Tax=Austropuccinia psidii MF-1 TaxID=1389203 RepID=A0A9Q3GVK5_9BASI|nr:hypothetical protein [Austropuccinia psidii MF-1]